MIRKNKTKRDIEKNYPAKQFVIKLRRLADSIEQGITISDSGGRRAHLYSRHGYYQYRTRAR